MSTPWARFNQAGAAKNLHPRDTTCVLQNIPRLIPPNSHFIDSVDYGTGLVTLDAESSFLSSTMTSDVKVVVIEIVVIVERRAEVRPRRDVEKNGQKVQDVFALRGNGYFPAPCRGTRENKTDKETTINNHIFIDILYEKKRKFVKLEHKRKIQY